jgi:hypothetical protein
MNCQAAKTFLLQAESLEATAWPSALREHVSACAKCARLAWKIRRLEDSWRDQAPPAEAETSKAAFLKKLGKRHAAKPAKNVPATEPALRTWRPLRWLGAAAMTAAAMILIAIGGVGYLLFAPGETRASSDVVDRLIDLNVEMSNADAKERQRLLSEHEGRLRNDLVGAKLTEEERQFAEELLESARELAENDDPIEDAGRITDLADQLKVREETAKKTGNDKEVERCKQHWEKVMKGGYNPIMDRIIQFKTPEGMKKPGFDNFKKYDPSKQQQLQKAAEIGAERFRQDARKTIESMRKKGGGKGPFGGGHRK